MVRDLRSYIVMALVLIFLFSDPISVGSTSVIKVASSQDLGKQFEAEKRQMASQWYQMEAEEHAKWQRFRRSVNRKWNTFLSSTRKQWVAYDPSYSARSTVDFEKGAIKIEAIVETDSGKVAQSAKENIVAKIKMVFGQEDIDSHTMLEDQVQDRQGRIVTRDRLDEYLQEEIAPSIRADPVPFVAKDGRTRKRFSVTIPMVPDHLEIRARKYRSLVIQNAKRFHLPPEMIMAMIHTESFFNPMAVSKDGAIGLMQLIPRHGGREAYRFLYENDWIIRPEYLYTPGINIELGTAYIHLLENRYFTDIKNLQARHYISICAYNWGPTAVRNRILKRYRMVDLDHDSVYNLLSQNTPEETRDYLARVVRRTVMYKAYFDS